MGAVATVGPVSISVAAGSWSGSGGGESGYIRLERFGEGSEPCGTDSTPQDGMACAGDTTPVQYCGKCAILSASSYPTGVSAAPPTPTPPSPPSPSPSPSPSYYWYWDSAKSVVV